MAESCCQVQALVLIIETIVLIIENYCADDKQTKFKSLCSSWKAIVLIIKNNCADYYIQPTTTFCTRLQAIVH